MSGGPLPEAPICRRHCMGTGNLFLGQHAVQRACGIGNIANDHRATQWLEEFQSIFKALKPFLVRSPIPVTKPEQKIQTEHKRWVCLEGELNLSLALHLRLNEEQRIGQASNGLVRHQQSSIQIMAKPIFISFWPIEWLFLQEAGGRACPNHYDPVPWGFGCNCSS